MNQTRKQTSAPSAQEAPRLDNKEDHVHSAATTAADSHALPELLHGEEHKGCFLTIELLSVSPHYGLMEATTANPS